MNHFFDTDEKRHLMQLAADVVAQGLVDDHLGAITPSGGDAWSASFPDPTTGASRTFANLSIPADTIVVYVGGRPFAASAESGSGSAGGFSATGDPAWLATVAGRGVAGALGPSPSRFGPWGGSIAFDTASTRWFFGDTATGLTPGLTDFFTVAEHELGHVLGIGTSAAWLSHVSGDFFTGPASMAVYGGPVPLSASHSHWADGVRSDGVNAVMDPVIYGGNRSMFTALDDAALADVGWPVRTPERIASVEFAAAGATVAIQDTTAVIDVERTGGLGSFSVNYAAGGGTARAEVDYVPTAGTLTFGIGEMGKTILVPILHDPGTDATRTFNLYLGGPSPGASLGPQGMTTISISNGVRQPAADFDGDGRSDLAVFRPSTAQWLIQPSGATAGVWGPINFGAANLIDVPAAADYDRVGHAEPTVFRPATAQWFIAGYARPFGFGAAGLVDIPVPADYDGLGYDQPAVFRPATGQWFIAGHAAPVSFGATDLFDIPVPGDYDGVGHAELAVFRPSTAQWFIAGHPTPIQFGASGLFDIPVPGDYDGVGHTELAVFRPSTAQWFIAGHPAPIQFGAANLVDLPLEAPIGSLLKLGLLADRSQSIRPAAQGPADASATIVAANLPVSTAETTTPLPRQRRHRRAHHPARRSAPGHRALR